MSYNEEILAAVIELTVTIDGGDGCTDIDIKTHLKKQPPQPSKVEQRHLQLRLNKGSTRPIHRKAGQEIHTPHQQEG